MKIKTLVRVAQTHVKAFTVVDAGGILIIPVSDAEGYEQICNEIADALNQTERIAELENNLKVKSMMLSMHSQRLAIIAGLERKNAELERNLAAVKKNLLASTQYKSVKEIQAEHLSKELDFERSKNKQLEAEVTRLEERFKTRENYLNVRLVGAHTAKDFIRLTEKVEELEAEVVRLKKEKHFAACDRLVSGETTIKEEVVKILSELNDTITELVSKLTTDGEQE